MVMLRKSTSKRHDPINQPVERSSWVAQLKRPPHGRKPHRPAEARLDSSLWRYYHNSLASAALLRWYMATAMAQQGQRSAREYDSGQDQFRIDTHLDVHLAELDGNARKADGNA
jgi:hypothetical protein